MITKTGCHYLRKSALVSLVVVMSSLPQLGLAHAQNANRSASNTANPRVISNPNALFQPKVTITRDNQSNTVAQQTQFTPQTSPPPAAEERRVVPPVPQDPRSVPPINQPVQPQMPGRVPGIVPPFRRITTPPVGDIAVSTFPYQPDQVDIGSTAPFTFTGAGAPVQAVLAAIARQAGLNIYFVPPNDAVAIPITVDIKNVSAQQAFNDVLRIAKLQASRIGDRIFVGASLPINLQNIVTRSLRLNQITVGEASAFLISLGAERVVNRQRPIPGVQAATAIGPGGTAVVPPVQLETVPTLERVGGTAEFSKPILQGLQVVGEERGNTITLIGPKNLVALAEAQLARIDIRKRQVALNVKIIEVQLDDGSSFGTEFAFGLGDASDFRFIPSAFVPGQAGPAKTTIGINTVVSPVQGLLATITAGLQSGRTKILTDPTVIVQEGETSDLAVVQKVPTRSVVTETITGGSITRTVEIQEADAGLTLKINVNRIDDNGFINLSVAPTVSTPQTQLTVVSAGLPSTFTPLSTRTLTTGQIRIRDNQTLILTGVIQDQDRNTVVKLPILGDIPILGALFRREENVSTRSEIVVMITPRIIDDSQNANWGYTYQPSPDTQRVIDSNQITLPQGQDNRLNQLDRR
ncbi:MAG: type II secretory pathway, component HofQ [Pseudanabaenaceae cyanobacterium]